MRTPITYYGGKQNLSERIVSMMPRHKIYCEPFFGGGAVFFAKPKAGIEVINDKNDLLINFFKVCQSSNYFGDLIKKETGKTAQENIQDRIISLAKEWILGTNKTVSQIAYDLGFQYSQHFSRIFKKTVWCTPNEYRISQMS